MSTILKALKKLEQNKDELQTGGLPSDYMGPGSPHIGPRRGLSRFIGPKLSRSLILILVIGLGSAAFYFYRQARSIAPPTIPAVAKKESPGRTGPRVVTSPSTQAKPPGGTPAPSTSASTDDPVSEKTEFSPQKAPTAAQKVPAPMKWQSLKDLARTGNTSSDRPAPDVNPSKPPAAENDPNSVTFPVPAPTAPPDQSPAVSPTQPPAVVPAQPQPAIPSASPDQAPTALPDQSPAASQKQVPAVVAARPQPLARTAPSDQSPVAPPAQSPEVVPTQPQAPSAAETPAQAAAAPQAPAAKSKPVQDDPYKDIASLTDGRLKVQAIAWSSRVDERMAVINTRIVYEGDQVDGFRIAEIRHDDVVVREKGTYYRVLFGRP